MCSERGAAVKNDLVRLVRFLPSQCRAMGMKHFKAPPDEQPMACSYSSSYAALAIATSSSPFLAFSKGDAAAISPSCSPSWRIRKKNDANADSFEEVVSSPRKGELCYMDATKGSLHSFGKWL